MRGAALAAGYSVPFAFRPNSFWLPSPCAFFRRRTSAYLARHAVARAAYYRSGVFPAISRSGSQGVQRCPELLFRHQGTSRSPVRAAARSRGLAPPAHCDHSSNRPFSGNAAGQDRDETAAKMVGGLSRSVQPVLRGRRCSVPARRPLHPVWPSLLRRVARWGRWGDR